MKTFDKYINESIDTTIVDSIREIVTSENKFEEHEIVFVGSDTIKMHGEERALSQIQKMNPDFTIETIKNSVFSDEKGEFFMFNEFKQCFEPITMNFKTQDNSYRIVKDGLLHSVMYPAVCSRIAAFILNGDTVARVARATARGIHFEYLKSHASNHMDELLEMLSNFHRYIPLQDIIEVLDAEEIDQDIKNKLKLAVLSGFMNSKDKTHAILHLIQPDVFSDKAVKLLMDKIPLNLAYFILTKHMELYSNILSCYSDKHKFIEDMKKGDDVHHMGIASALERLIKHEI